MAQLLLFPDPQPLVERLGREFFLNAPRCPGVYIMRDADDTPVYVGKAKDLRQRLAAYRVANPERLRRRHLKLLRTVARIDLEKCPDEASALAREADLLRTLRPRFNRAGTWPAPGRFFSWRQAVEGLQLAVWTGTPQEGWFAHGPMGMNAFLLRAALARLLWCAIHPDRGLAGLPAGWFAGVREEVLLLPTDGTRNPVLAQAADGLQQLVLGRGEPLLSWISESIAGSKTSFEVSSREADLELVRQFVERVNLSANLS